MRITKKVLASVAIALSLSGFAAPALADDGADPNRNTWADSVVVPDGGLNAI